MATIEKEKALDVIRQMVADGQVSQEVAEKYFPQLKESDGEGVRKAIQIYLDWLDGRKDYAPKGEYTIRDMLAWIEKQGQVKESIISQHENKMCKENDDPLTSEDERIRKSMLNHLKDIINGEDVEFPPQDSLESWIAWLEKQGNLMKALQTSNAEIGQLIEKNYYLKEQLEKQGEQKSAWSEEDENRINRLIAYFEDKESFTAEDDIVYANWLKYLKNRVLPQPKQEWSERDKVILGKCLDAASGYYSPEYKQCMKDWLKSLRPQKQWKPSEEQMKAFEQLEEMHVLGCEKTQENANLYVIIKSLKEQLKQL